MIRPSRTKYAVRGGKKVPANCELTRTYSSSGFLPPIVFNLANTASTLRSSLFLSAVSNSGSLRVVSAAGSKVAVWVVPANEELMIARHALELVEAA